MSVDGATTAVVSEKNTLFDLRSIISADDLKQINIIQKTVSTVDRTDQTLNSNRPEIELLNSLQISRPRLFKFRDRSNQSRETAMNVEKSNQPVTDAKNPVGDIKTTSGSTRATVVHGEGTNQSAEKVKTTEADKYQYEYKDQLAAKQSNNTENRMVNPTGSEKSTQSFNTFKGNNQTVDDVNSSNQLNQKPADSQVQIKTSDLAASKGAGVDTMETAEKIIGQIKSKMAITPEHTRMTIDLKPKSLGKIRIDFKYEQENIKALIQVESSKVKLLLETELPRLKEELKIDSFKVEVNSNNFHQGADARNHRHLFSQFEDNQMPGYKDSKESEFANENKASDKAAGGYSGGTHTGMVNLLA